MFILVVGLETRFQSEATLSHLTKRVKKISIPHPSRQLLEEFGVYVNVFIHMTIGRNDLANEGKRFSCLL